MLAIRVTVCLRCKQRLGSLICPLLNISSRTLLQCPVDVGGDDIDAVRANDARSFCHIDSDRRPAVAVAIYTHIEQ